MTSLRLDGHDVHQRGGDVEGVGDDQVAEIAAVGAVKHGEPPAKEIIYCRYF